MFVPKEKEPIKKYIKYIGIFAGLYILFAVLPYLYMMNQFSAFEEASPPFIVNTLSSLPLSKGVKLSQGCSVDPFFYTASSVTNNVSNIELIEAAFGDGEVEQIATFSVSVQFKKKKNDLVVEVHKMLDGQVRLCRLHFAKKNKSNFSGNIHDKMLNERNMHFTGDVQEKFKRWLDKEEVPYSTYILDNKEYVSWDNGYSQRVKEWPYFPSGYWDSPCCSGSSQAK